MSMPVGMMKTKEVKAYVKSLEVEGCSVEADYKDACTAKAMDGDITVFWALQKGRNGPWIVRFTNSDRIQWG